MNVQYSNLCLHWRKRQQILRDHGVTYDTYTMAYNAGELMQTLLSKESHQSYKTLESLSGLAAEMNEYMSIIDYPVTKDPRNSGPIVTKAIDELGAKDLNFSRQNVDAYGNITLTKFIRLEDQTYVKIVVGSKNFPNPSDQILGNTFAKEHSNLTSDVTTMIKNMVVRPYRDVGPVWKDMKNHVYLLMKVEEAQDGFLLVENLTRLRVGLDFLGGQGRSQVKSIVEELNARLSTTNYIVACKGNTIAEDKQEFLAIKNQHRLYDLKDYDGLFKYIKVIKMEDGKFARLTIGSQRDLELMDLDPLYPSTSAKVQGLLDGLVARRHLYPITDADRELVTIAVDIAFSDVDALKDLQVALRTESKKDKEKNLVEMNRCLQLNHMYADHKEAADWAYDKFGSAYYLICIQLLSKYLECSVLNAVQWKALELLVGFTDTIHYVMDQIPLANIELAELYFRQINSNRV
jgi:hypothetical protein